MNNKVLLIGEVHHNGLGLVRDFGVNGLKPYGIIIEKENERNYVKSSRYWEKTWSVNNEIEAISLALSLFSRETERVVLIPWSDRIAREIDENYTKLSASFLLPSVNSIEGEISRLMNKSNQARLCRMGQISMMESEIINLNEAGLEKNLEYKTILKPVTSADGEKKDICICDSLQSYQEALQRFKNKGYISVLKQKYLENKEEYLLTGCVHGSFVAFSVTRNIRQWPRDFGTASFFEVVVDEEIGAFSNRVMNLLKEVNYSGLVDVEFFKSGKNEFYINEINWRSSGRNFVGLFTGVNPAYLYYNCLVHKTENRTIFNDKHGYGMNEMTDLRHVIIGHEISLFRWLKDLCKANCFALYYGKDLKPLMHRCCDVILKMLNR